MVRPPLRSVLAGLALAAAAAGLSTITTSTPAAAFEGRWERGFHDRPHGWRPPPPLHHGYWGRRHWRRYHDGYGFRPPPPPYGRGYGYGWR